MIATRTEARTAMDSRTSVRRAPIAVVIALSAWGRFKVITATRSSSTYSTRTGSDGSSTPEGGAPKSSAFQRSVPVAFMPTSSPRSRREVREPPQRAKPGDEQVLAAARDHERRQALEPAPDRLTRDREGARAVVGPHQRVLLGRGPDEDAVVHPLRLDELVLALQVCAREDEDDSAVRAVVLQDSLGQDRPVARPAADHPMEAHVDAPVVVERIPWVRATGVRAGGGGEAAWVVAVEELVVSPWALAGLGGVAVRGERQWRTALPAAHHLGAQQRLIGAARRAFAQVPAVQGLAGVQLHEGDIGAVATQHFRVRHRGHVARLVAVAEDELAGLERLLQAVGWGDPAALDGWLADPVLERERRA